MDQAFLKIEITKGSYVGHGRRVTAMSASRGSLPKVTTAAFMVLLTACAGVPEREGMTSAQSHMYAHLDRTGEVHDALVRGDMEGARRGSDWLATHQETVRLPQGSEPYGSTMTSYAIQVREATDLEEAAVSAARMAGACGECHREYAVGPRLLTGAPPPGGGGAKAEMALHVWASERMWNGLVGPDDYAWSSGASALTRGWLSPQDVVADPDSREEVRNLVQEVYELGTRAGTTSDPHQRAEVYGDFLTTCIDCHLLTGAIIG